MFTLRIANYLINENDAKTMLENKYEYSLVSEPFYKISDMNGKTCFWIESD